MEMVLVKGCNVRVGVFGVWGEVIGDYRINGWWRSFMGLIIWCGFWCGFLEVWEG